MSKTCDCTKIPFSDDCLEYCIEKILRVATPEEKQNIIGLSKDLAQKIFLAYNAHSINSFYDLRQYISDSEVVDLRNKFKNLNEFQMTYFKNKL